MMILAVFRSRSESLDFAQRLRSYGVTSETVAAPKEARIGCGLCVRFEEKVFNRAKAVLITAKYKTFKGFYKTEFRAGRMTVLPFGKRI